MQRLNPADEAIIAQARTVFSTRPGQTVLAWILGDCGAFDPIPTTAEAVALRNWSMKLLAVLGGGGMAVENVEDFTLRLMKQPITNIKKEDS